jgi:hypothetical protein
MKEKQQECNFKLIEFSAKVDLANHMEHEQASEDVQALLAHQHSDSELY